MKLYYYIVFLIFLISSTPNDCSLNNALKMDYRLLEIKDENNNADTLILYRHWTHTNGEYGYSKVFIKANNKYSKKIIIFNDEDRTLSESDWSSIKNSVNPIEYISNTDLSKLKGNLEKSWVINHDGLHTVMIYSKSKLIYCDEVHEHDLMYNSNNSRVEFLKILRDTAYFTQSLIRVDGKENFKK